MNVRYAEEISRARNRLNRAVQELRLACAESTRVADKIEQRLIARERELAR